MLPVSPALGRVAPLVAGLLRAAMSVSEGRKARPEGERPTANR